jgi:5-methylcytosine-specific restriction endonuclease McrA
MDTLLLNADHRPISVITWKEAMTFIVEDSVQVVAFYPDRFINSATQRWQIPCVIALKKYVRTRQVIPFSRKGVYTRDEHRCQYCGAEPDKKTLTLDHVVPKSRGGKKNYENIVTSCQPCNQKKANRTPLEAGMCLLNIPKKPSPHQLLELTSEKILSAIKDVQIKPWWVSLLEDPAKRNQ